MKTYNRSLLSFAFSVIVLSALNVVVVSCRSASSRLLDRIAAMVTERPEEALFILAEIDTTGFSVLEKAQVVYLRTRAAAKADLPLTWPDEMCDAAKVLAEHTSDRDEQSMAYYYAGYAYFENNRLADAVREYHNSERIIDGDSAAPMLYYVYNALYDCYYKQSLYEEAIDYSVRRIRAAFARLDTLSAIDGMYALAHLNVMLNNFTVGWDYYARLQQLMDSYSQEVPELQTLCYNGKATILRDLGQLEESLLCNDTALVLGGDAGSYSCLWLTRGANYYKQGIMDSAIYYLNLSLIDYDIERRHRCYDYLCDIYKVLGDKRNAAVYSDSLLYYKALVKAEEQAVGIKRSDAQHLEELQKKALLRERIMWQCIVLVISLISVGLFVVLVRFHRRKKAASLPTMPENPFLESHNSELCAPPSSSMPLESELQESPSSLASYNSELCGPPFFSMSLEGEPLRSQFFTIPLDSELWVSRRRVIPQSLIDKLESAYSSFQNTPSYEVLLQLRKDPTATFSCKEQKASYDELKKEFLLVKDELKRLGYRQTDENCVLLCLCYMNLSNEELARYFKPSENAIRQRKSRIKKKLPQYLYDFFVK